MQKIRTTLSVALLSSSLLLTNSALAAEVKLINDKQQNITINHQALFPEDIRYDAHTENFIVGSVRDGVIYHVNAKGETTALIKDDRLTSVLGIQIDRKNDRLYAAVSDLGISTRHYEKGTKKLAALAIYQLSTGKNLQFTYLDKLFPHDHHLANGLAIDTTGNAYLTDSFSATIYKITPEGKASIFLSSTKFEGEGINLNGATVINNRFLIVAKKSEGILFKIPLDTPKNFSTVSLNEKMIGADGIVYIDDSTLAIVANQAVGVSSNAAYILSSQDEWKTAKLEKKVDLGDVYPTNGVVMKDKLYVMHSNLNHLVKTPVDKKGTLTNRATLRLIGTIEK